MYDEPRSTHIKHVKLRINAGRIMKRGFLSPRSNRRALLATTLQLRLIAMVLTHVHSQISALLRLVRAVRALVRRLLVAAFVVLVPAQRRFPAVGFAAVSARVDLQRFVGTAGTTSAAAATAKCQRIEAANARGRTLLMVRQIEAGEHIARCPFDGRGRCHVVASTVRRRHGFHVAVIGWIATDLRSVGQLDVIDVRVLNLLRDDGRQNRCR